MNKWRKGEQCLPVDDLSTVDNYQRMPDSEADLEG